MRGYITSSKVQEASGLAMSQYSDDRFWTHNDSYNTAALFEFDRDGTLLHQLDILGVKNRDWEDLASFSIGDKHYIAIGDIGDNFDERDVYSIHVIEEPDPSTWGEKSRTAVRPSWSIKFVYPDGYHDCESLAYDPHTNSFLLLTKRDAPPVFYSLPLKPDNTEQVVTAKHLGEIAPIPGPASFAFRLTDIVGITDWPTAMDISRDGKQLVVLTYGTAYRYAYDGRSWLSSLKRLPTEVPFPALEQAEAVAFDNQAQHILITSEKLPAPIRYLPIE